MTGAAAAIRTFGRLRARPVKPRQAALMEALLPKVAAPEGAFDPRDLAPNTRETWLEIGFGGGEHLTGQAARRPDVLMLGAEPFVNGVASALRHIDAAKLSNVRLCVGDGRELMTRLPEASITRLFLLFPDPWPKRRHHKRRLITGAFIAEAARVLAPGGRLRFATDWTDYLHWTLLHFLQAPAFAWTARRADDWRVPPADHVTTRYEEKRLGDCAPAWLEFERRAAGADASASIFAPVSATTGR